jgi:hypothetical protein
MKKILPALVLIGFLAVLITPMMVSAQTAAPEGCEIKRDVGMGDECPGVGSECLYSDTSYNCGICCLLNTIYGITDIIFVVLIALAAVFVIIGAMTLLTAAGAPEKVTTGRNYIMYAAIGLVVAFLAKAIPVIVKFIVAPSA